MTLSHEKAFSKANTQPQELMEFAIEAAKSGQRIDVVAHASVIAQSLSSKWARGYSCYRTIAARREEDAPERAAPLDWALLRRPQPQGE